VSEKEEGITKRLTMVKEGSRRTEKECLLLPLLYWESKSMIAELMVKEVEKTDKGNKR
jgi:hypothetical protein